MHPCIPLFLLQTEQAQHWFHLDLRFETFPCHCCPEYTWAGSMIALVSRETLVEGHGCIRATLIYTHNRCCLLALCCPLQCTGRCWQRRHPGRSPPRPRRGRLVIFLGDFQAATCCRNNRPGLAREASRAERAGEETYVQRGAAIRSLLGS